jgi:L-arabinonolactonase
MLAPSANAAPIFPVSGERTPRVDRRFSKGGNMAGQAEIAVNSQNLLGEGIVWSASHGEVQWVDIHGKLFWTLDPSTGVAKSLALPERLGCFAPLGASRILAGFASGLAYFDLSSGARNEIAAIEPDLPSTRVNDGKLDRQGRLVFGTMDENEPAQPIGRVWSFDGVAPRALFEGVRIANSIAFSPDGRRMYFADTPQRIIWRYDYDVDTGLAFNRKAFVEVGKEHGYPDGSCVDSEGCLWNAKWGGGRVVRYSPDGRIDHIVEVPCSQATCCAFGGADLSTLYVTTARAGLSEARLVREPKAGAMFAVKVGVRGLVDAPFKGAA